MGLEPAPEGRARRFLVLKIPVTPRYGGWAGGGGGGAPPPPPGEAPSLEDRMTATVMPLSILWAVTGRCQYSFVKLDRAEGQGPMERERERRKVERQTTKRMTTPKTSDCTDSTSDTVRLDLTNMPSRWLCRLLFYWGGGMLVSALCMSLIFIATCFRDRAHICGSVL